MPSSSEILEEAARKLCLNCERAYQMRLQEKKGHVLRYRDDTKEWVHDFRTDTSTPKQKSERFEHYFCNADTLRKQHGG